MKHVSLLLRIGIGLTFLYAGISSLLYPSIWAGFIPTWMTQYIPAITLLTMHAIIELCMVVWLWWGKKLYYAGIMSALLISLIVITNIEARDVVFRDIPIIFSALALALLHKKDT